MRTKHVVFLFNLLQDVNILRPLIYLTAREFDVRILILVSAPFLERDTKRIWQRELAEIGADVGADMHIYPTPIEAFAILQGKQGLIFAASESSLSTHAQTHDVFRIAPASFRKITLQHGYECVGFLNNREHDIAHGRNVTFAADIVCGWSAAGRLKSLFYTERSKLYVTGPSPILQTPAPPPEAPRPSGGLVCENLHSIRMKASGDVTASFIETFQQFCDRLREVGETVNLRPHPGGQYTLKNDVSLPDNVVVQNLPMYRVDLPAYDYGLSAPSSVLIDLLLAGIPVAVWQDRDAVIDGGNYAGLTQVSGVDDWLRFAADAKARPEQALERQRAYLDGLEMVIDRAEVYRRFARLIGGALDGVRQAVPSNARAAPVRRERRVFFIANGEIPTLQLSFFKPLGPLIQTGEIVTDFVYETDLDEMFGRGLRGAHGPKAAEYLKTRIAEFAPDVIVGCRYSGPHTALIADLAAELGVALMFHVDDDLLNIPREIGEKKFIGHNRPERLNAVRTLLKRADLVYCSTKRLKRRFRELGFSTPMAAGEIYCSGAVMNPAEMRPVLKIGYMGFDHAHDLEMILPTLVRYLRRNTEIAFELFGSIPKPDVLDEFGERVVMVPPVRGYGAFLQAFAERNWDIGVCPLVRSPFNEVKANTKWVEYTAVGAAVIASRDTVYDACGADGCAILADGPEEWLAALERLTDDPAERFRQVARAQARLTDAYGEARLRQQALGMFAKAEEIAADRRDDRWAHAAPGPLATLATPLAAF